MVPSRLLAVIGALVQTQRCLAGLRITGVIDGPLTDGLPKTIELYADTGIPDLSIYGVTSANNGNGQETVEYEFENLMVPAGSFLYLNQGNGDSFREYFELSEAETPEFFFPNKNVANINGDDAILLFENGVKIDAFGDNNVDGTGEVWEYLDGWAYRMSETDPSPTFILDNWDVENKNALDDTTKNSAAANGFPLGTYTATVGVNNDPVVAGLHGQTFLFKGEDGGWYAGLAETHLQWNLRLHVFPECENNALPTYITASAFTIASPDGKSEEQVLLEVMDVTKYNPTYVEGEEAGGLVGEEQTLGYGSFKYTVEGTELTTPGIQSLSNGGVVMAFNAYGPCQLKRTSNLFEELMQEEKLLKAAAVEASSPLTARRLAESAAPLSDLDALLLVEQQLHVAEDKALCEDWIADKRVKRNLFTEPGSWASVFILTDTYSFQVDYRQEVERCHAHVMDVTFIRKPNDEGVEQWSGVLGETQRVKHTPDGRPILRGRDLVLSSVRDEDYRVDGPWGTDFAARLESEWR